MITHVTLENFQSHPKLELPMGKLTMLTGTSNSGKSAVLRALAGLLRNDSAGSYIRHGQKQLKVIVTTDDGYVVEWIKGNGANDYILHEPGVDAPRKFEKVGSHVPDEIKDVLRMSPINLTDKIKLHANLHEQLESPFLVSSDYTAGDAAKIFGELTSASKLYAAVAEGNRRQKAANTLRKTRAGDLEKLADDLKEFDDLDAQTQGVADARELWDRSIDAGYAFNSAKELLLFVAEATTDLEKFDSWLKPLTVATEVDLTDATVATAQHERLSRLIADVETVQTALDTLTRLEVPLTEAAQADFSGAQAVEEQIEGILAHLDQISPLDNMLRVLSESEVKAENTLAALETELMEAYTSLDTCPSCGQELADHAKEHLLGAV